MGRLGVAVIGLNGAVSSTMVAGVRLMLKGAVERYGMLTEAVEGHSQNVLSDLLAFCPLEDLVFGGWDLNDRTLYDSALEHGVLRADQLVPVKEELQHLRPWRAVFHADYAANLKGAHVLCAPSFREEISAIRQDLQNFKTHHQLDRVVMVNLASTEKWSAPSPTHANLSAFEAGLDCDDPSITPTMRYVYAANSLGTAHLNFTPSLAHIPALDEQAIKHAVPYAGMDGKTGQTLVKTAMASMFRARRLYVDGWYSTNFLGNNDGLVLDSPESNKTKVLSKTSVLDSILGHKVDNHQVHIHYYKPRGDAKEAWDNIDFTGFGGVPMQMKINFLCQDSVLAAPLVLDVVRLLDVAQDQGEKGIQSQFSMFFKSPYHSAEGGPEHDFFKQERMLFEWAHKVAKTEASSASASNKEPGAQGSAAVSDRLEGQNI
jgi:myo-inositol-1-phosphate synthase